jgi:hypothetical protein
LCTTGCTQCTGSKKKKSSAAQNVRPSSDSSLIDETKNLRENLGLQMADNPPLLLLGACLRNVVIALPTLNSLDSQATMKWVSTHQAIKSYACRKLRSWNLSRRLTDVGKSKSIYFAHMKLWILAHGREMARTFARDATGPFFPFFVACSIEWWAEIPSHQGSINSVAFHSSIISD